jgi:hypothetical protein
MKYCRNEKQKAAGSPRQQVILNLQHQSTHDIAKNYDAPIFHRFLG